MPQFNRDEVTKVVKDAVYATVGLGVLTVQQLDHLRRQLSERLSAQLGVGKDQVEQLAKAIEAQLRTIDDRVKVLEGQLDGLLDGVQDRLPEQAGDVMARARKAAADARKAAVEASGKLSGMVRDAAA